MNYWDNINNALSPLTDCYTKINNSLFQINNFLPKFNDIMYPLKSWKDNMTKSLHPIIDACSQMSSFAQIQMSGLKSTITAIQMLSNDSLSSINSFIDSLNWQNTIINMPQTLRNIFKPLNINGIFDGSILEEEINVLDEELQKQFVSDSINAVETLTQQKGLSDNEKKTWLRKFWKVTWKTLKEFAVCIVIPLILFIFGPYYNLYFESNEMPKYYYSQYQEIQQENPALDLRMITRDVPLYKGKKMKHQMAYLSKYEIVEVLEYHEEKIKIRVYHSEDEIGWIYKKYTTK